MGKIKEATSDDFERFKNLNLTANLISLSNTEMREKMDEEKRRWSLHQSEVLMRFKLNQYRVLSPRRRRPKVTRSSTQVTFQPPKQSAQSTSDHLAGDLTSADAASARPSSDPSRRRA